MTKFIVDVVMLQAAFRYLHVRRYLWQRLAFMAGEGLTVGEIRSRRERRNEMVKIFLKPPAYRQSFYLWHDNVGTAPRRRNV